MIRTMVISVMAAGSLLAGCSSQQLYAAGRQSQKSECNKLREHAQRDRCHQDANMSHDAYRRATEPQSK